jgi:hypothetical protein
MFEFKKQWNQIIYDDYRKHKVYTNKRQNKKLKFKERNLNQIDDIFCVRMSMIIHDIIWFLDLHEKKSGIAWSGDCKGNLLLININFIIY